MICFPNAKINLGLNIGDERLDGLHNIDSFFLPIKLCDALDVVECLDQNAKIKVNYSGLTKYIENDLVIKAYNILDMDFNLPNIKVHLHKNIPFGAGLGGGSSDAAHMLIILNNIFDLKLTKKDLLFYAKKLGSDCSFFIHNKPSFVSGSGDVICPNELTFNSKVNNKQLCNLFLVKPKKINISSSDIFSSWREMNFLEAFKNNKRDSNIKDLLMDSFESYKDNLHNDLEHVSFNKYPQLKDIKKYLYKKGAIYASMTGSGSCIYGIFSKKINLEELDFLKEDFFIWKDDFN